MNKFFLAVALTASMFLSGCAVHKLPEPECQQVKGKNHLEAENHVLYAMMSSNSYHQDKKRGYFPIEVLGWEQIDHEGNVLKKSRASYKNAIGLAFDVWRKKDNGDIVVAFRGTDSWFDYLTCNLPFFSPCYKSAFKQYEEVQSKYKGKITAVTGHSLGGGLALGTSLRYGVQAIVFDPSPRVFDGLGDHSKDAKRISIFQDSEVLSRFRDKHSKYKELIENGTLTEYHVCYDFGTSSLHSGNKLAEKMLEHARLTDKSLEPVYSGYMDSL